ncbi:class I adenylate-forming enzyme family protein [Conexibacter sp. CPCC 206217]|uniref:class I adenylate-forming enzyme family protein n=1 Tax=Conexibacter sp. CPCC 206217 TaxID=3064574 RepID=UPI00271B8CBB|nr:AMP-binding protein [Conexibacter sp. CPCC 206217]MDO8212456.1 AMP-binding protein [Conexibacter sp. CPCC 206217]
MGELAPGNVKLDLSRAARWNDLALPYLLERDGLDLAKPAIVFEERSRTYGELRDAARRVANALIGLGIEEMDRVAVLSANRLEFIELEVGISAARGIMVPLNWRLRAGELANLLRRCAARAIFVEERFLGTILELRRSGELPDLRSVITLDGSAGDLSYDELCGSSSAERPPRQGLLDDPHEIIFTSGTTGKPKGVVWTNGTLMWNSLQQVTDYQLGPQHSTYAIIDLYYIGGRHDFTWPILHQGGTVHVKRSSGFDAQEVVRYVAEQRISHVLWVPTMLYEILRLPTLGDYDFSALRMIMCGGQPVSVATTERAQTAFPSADFIQVYGLTEGGGSVTFVRPQDARAKPGSAGKPSQHVQIRLADPEGLEVPQGKDGEILVRAPSVTAGYWDDPELTERQIVDGWLHTGDMGRFDADGFLFISGRKGDMIISGGMNIFPTEIEDVLREHPAVADVAVIGVPHEKWGETVCAVVESADGHVVQEEELIVFCTERLAGYKKPAVVHVVDALPRTAGGKPKKFLLRERFTNVAESMFATSVEERDE